MQRDFSAQNTGNFSPQAWLFKNGGPQAKDICDKLWAFLHHAHDAVKFSGYDIKGGLHSNLIELCRLLEGLRR